MILISQSRNIGSLNYNYLYPPHQTGIIRASRDTLLVRPLPARLARHVTDNFKTLPHLVIKISVMPRLRQRRSLDSGVKKYLEAALVVLTDMENKYGYNGTVQRLLVMANIVSIREGLPAMMHVRITCESHVTYVFRVPINVALPLQISL